MRVFSSSFASSRDAKSEQSTAEKLDLDLSLKKIIVSLFFAQEKEKQFTLSLSLLTGRKRRATEIATEILGRKDGNEKRNSLSLTPPPPPPHTHTRKKPEKRKTQNSTL